MVALTVTAGFLGALVVWGLQIFFWLKTGIWAPAALLNFVVPPELEWRGIQKLIEWVFGFNMGFLSILVGTLFGGIFAALEIDDRLQKLNEWVGW